MKHKLGCDDLEIPTAKKTHTSQLPDELDLIFSDMLPAESSIYLSSSERLAIDAEIDQALSGFDFSTVDQQEQMSENQTETSTKEESHEELDTLITASNESKPQSSNVSSSSENSTPFDSPETITTSITYNEEDIKKHTTEINKETLASIKHSMVNTSKVMSLFTTLKVTYLKLCKEFNYLLQKFNENEKIKIELINENNELRKLLTEIITKRELERKRAKELESKNGVLELKLMEKELKTN
ncbi:predicted protein [Scheffersomyces stipitis CBS 6054]|uniref:Uncharacterized protein n=1 Tax=Scheffersomyces stipitis (strain ATCC 58785 / CBS 6054 / NBRC 10063 / NRRL Y-11545) TaxID=322104 RepID=A3LZL9_PICST|nr:predicted protein [Scheffersomyces stipitis CBS 6054]ABN68363.2 predicted protein [Scheffersomyces stipitis CBS 6054]KAG2734764.1 hypothetical protein G9P44_002770 [Scheffersomyces stipitis]